MSLPPPMQVEAPPADFVNHDDALAWIRTRLDPDGPPVLVMCSGPPGAGKNALLRQAANALAEGFPGGQLRFEYQRGTREDPDQALAAFLRALGVHQNVLAADPRAWGGEYRTFTRDKRLLVIIEGAWEPAQVRALVPTGRGSLVLVCGDRADLGELEIHPGAHVLDLEPLAAPHARTLLQRRAGRDLAEEDPECVDRIVHACAGLPLALVLAGAQLRRGGLGSARTLAPALRPLEEGHGVGVLAETVYGELSPEAAAAYRSLSAWPGAHCEASTVQAAVSAQALSELVSTDLMACDSTEGSVRFIHRLVRAHAQERAHAQDSPAERRRTLTLMLEAYLKVLGCAERAVRGERLRIVVLDTLLEGVQGPFDGDSEAARQWLSRERHTLLAAVLHAADLGLHEYAWQLAELSTALYLDERHLHEWRSSGEAGAAAARLADNPAAEARLCCLLSRPLADLRQRERAGQRLERAVELAEQVGDELLSGSVWEFYGRHLEGQDLEAAIAAYDRSVRHNQASTSASARRGAALSVFFRGIARCKHGQYEDAVTDIRTAQASLLELGQGPDRRMGARAGAALGRAQEAAGDLEGARQSLLAAEGDLADGGWHYYRAEVCEQLARVLQGLQQHEQARRQLEEAEQIYRRVGSPRAREVADRLHRQ